MIKSSNIQQFHKPGHSNHTKNLINNRIITITAQNNIKRKTSDKIEDKGSMKNILPSNFLKISDRLLRFWIFIFLEKTEY